MPSSEMSKHPNPRAEARRAAEVRRRILLIVGGLAVVAIVVVIAILSTGESGSQVTVEDVAGDVDVSGDPLPVFLGDSATDPAIGSTAPVVTGWSFDGEARAIGGATDGPQLITFMASWCPACQQELPELADWLDGGRLPEEVELVAVSSLLDASRPNWPPTDWFEEVGYPGPVMVDDAQSSAAEAFGLSGTPFWVAVNSDGAVVYRGSGMIALEDLDGLVAALADT